MPQPARADARPDSHGDEAQMLAYAAGDAAAFDALYARHRGGVYRYLLRHCGNAATADELFQDVWMNVIRVRASYEPTARFTTWLYRIAHNRLVDHWRDHGRADLVSIEHDDDEPGLLDAMPASRVDQPEVRADSHEQAARVLAAVQSSPAAQREAFLLHQEGELELSEIAELTGAGVETVKSRIRYALGKLRAELQDLR